MLLRDIWEDPSRKPRLALFIYFVFWKLLLLLTATTSPGPGYDTSTTLLDTSDGSYLFQRLVAKLLRWDAIYFVHVARRGAVYEQEWAFGWGFAKLLNSEVGGMSPQYKLRMSVTDG